MPLHADGFRPSVSCLKPATKLLCTHVLKLAPPRSHPPIQKGKQEGPFLSSLGRKEERGKKLLSSCSSLSRASPGSKAAATGAYGRRNGRRSGPALARVLQRRGRGCAAGGGSRARGRPAEPGWRELCAWQGSARVGRRPVPAPVWRPRPAMRPVPSSLLAPSSSVHPPPSTAGSCVGHARGGPRRSRPVRCGGGHGVVAGGAACGGGRRMRGAAARSRPRGGGARPAAGRSSADRRPRFFFADVA